MSNNRIEQMLDELEDYIDDCRYQPLSNSKILVNKEEIKELIGELRMRVPEEIKKYQKIISQQEAILKDAQAQAQNMLDDAQSQIDVLISDHEVTEKAYQKANEIVMDARDAADQIIDNAYADADTIRSGAIHYADSLIAEVQQVISVKAGESRRMMDDMFDVIQSIYDECADNRQKLQIPAQQDPEMEEHEAEEPAQ